jgi:hypothetical protein
MGWAGISTFLKGGHMRMKQRILISGAVLLMILAAAAGGALFAQQKSASPAKLSAEDWIEIRQLYSRYGQLVNEMTSEEDTNKIANLWTEDGVFDQPGSPDAPHAPYRGRKEIATEYIPAFRNNTEGVRSANRMFTDIGVVIEASPQGAIGKTSMVRVTSSAVRGQPTVIELTGEYHDEIVKTREGWKFKTRVFRRVAGGDPGFPPVSSTR